VDPPWIEPESLTKTTQNRDAGPCGEPYGKP